MPSCPKCASDETCSLSIQSCTACASTACVKIQPVSGSPSSNKTPQKSRSAAGAIAGGVVGGIVAIVIITYLVWRFCIKKRRQEFDDSDWTDENSGIEKGGDQFTMNRDARASTHTVGSIASTVLTRASNVIQIAYIPGVTNRSVESSPDLLIPPVPPIPAASMGITSASTPHVGGQDQHFFMPSDLRDSTFSGYSDRTSMSPSMARSSVATTIYRNNAVVNPVPAQAVTRGKAIPVSVKTSGKNSPTDTPRSATPPLPSLHSLRNGKIVLNPKSSIIGRVGTPKAVTIPRSPSGRTPEPAPISGILASAYTQEPQDRIINSSPQHSNDSSTFDDASSDEDVPPHVHAGISLMSHNRHSEATTMIQDSPASQISHFQTPVLSEKISSQSSPNVSLRDHTHRHKHRKSSSLNQIIEEATRRATREPRHGGLGSVRDTGPFSDEHVARTP
ncbi:hypothetical protein MMC24_001848 [Lignoscripta atroalba]|nr:hypothetical protein [Lignoscripta atroalba]